MAFNIPMKCVHHKDFASQIDWKHFHEWFKKVRGQQVKTNNVRKIVNG